MKKVIGTISIGVPVLILVYLFFGVSGIYYLTAFLISAVICLTLFYLILYGISLFFE